MPKRNQASRHILSCSKVFAFHELLGGRETRRVYLGEAELAKTDMKAVASRDAGYQEVQVELAQPAEHGIDADVPGATDDDLPLLLVRFRLEDGSFQAA